VRGGPFGRMLGILPLILALPGGAWGQTADSLQVHRVPVAAKVGKWVALGAALGMGLMAASSHDKAESAYGDLEQYCAPDRTRCDLTGGGEYADPVAEQFYQSSLRYDRHARRWFVGGEVALLGAIGLFIWEFTRPHDRPDNIPFQPEFRIAPSGARLGAHIAF
jgi:hypothetical protein